MVAFDWDTAQREFKPGVKTYLDSETCGLHGMMVLLQYAVDEGPIHLYDIWKEPVWKTLELLEAIAGTTVVVFNAVFDWFHVTKIHTIWSLLPRDWIPEDHIDEIAQIEPQGQNGKCIKPFNVLDLLLHSRKGPYQSLMAREDVRIRRVPTALAYALAEELENRIEIDGIYFAKGYDKNAPRWQVFDIKMRDGSINPDFKDVVLRFNAAGGLKYLAEYAMGYEPKFHFADVELDRSFWPKELGYAPTALAVSRPERNWEVYKLNDKGEKIVAGRAWPGVIKHHIKHWAENANAREYATDDIVYTRALDKHFGYPTPGDDDSVLACMVPVIRWRGFKINGKGLRALRRKAQAVIDNAPCNPNKPAQVREYVYECMDETEMLVLETSTKKANLQKVAAITLEEDEVCTKCNGEGHHTAGFCHRCAGSGTIKAGKHPAAIRAQNILDVKIAVKEVELYRKLLRARKFHASFNVVGTLSSRMSGGDGLNAQGIKAAKEVRSMFPMAWDDHELCGGDFDSFEVTLADAVYKDPDLRKALTTRVECHKCKGSGINKKREECGDCDGTGKTTKKIHALFAQCLYPGMSYEEIVATDGTQNNLYSKGKQGVFAMIYGGDYNTLVRNLGIPVETAKAAFDTWNKWFPQSAKSRERTFKAFCSMRQPDGTHVVWGEPAEYVESFLGFRRYFTLENMICKALYELARNVPAAWRKCKIKVVRRDRVQTAGGAVASALYGAAFQIQAANQRAAANHEIQSPGAEITKNVQRAIWDLQPAGVHELVVAPINIHDELLSVTHPSMVEPVTEAVRERVEHYREQVPLLGMTWNQAMESWAEKKGGSVTVKMRSPEMANAA